MGDDIHRLQAKHFKQSEIVHGFFGRTGGVSQGFYDSLNCGLGSSDKQENVNENRRRVADTLRIEKIVTPYQVHGTQCLSVSAEGTYSKRPEGDALVTDIPGFGIGVLTADCAPVIFAGQKPGGEPVIGIAHAGWKGALAGVLDSTIESLKALGADAGSIRAAIGPCIGPRSYQVREDFRAQFLKQDKGSERFFKSGREPDQFYFDLAGYCASRLNAASIDNIFICDADTYSESAIYFSYRRSCHNNEADYGRQISAIAIMP